MLIVDDLLELPVKLGEIVLNSIVQTAYSARERVLQESRSKIEEYSKHLEELVKEQTKEVRESQAYLESSLTSAPNGVVLFDKEVRFKYMNPAFFKWMGCESRDFLGKTVSEISPPIISPETTRIIAERVKNRVKTGEPIIGAEIELIDKEGKPMPVSYSAAGIKDETGSVIGARLPPMLIHNTYNTDR